MSDPRHGRARGEAIAGGAGPSLLRQIGFVAVTVALIAGLFFAAGTLLSSSSSSTARYVVYGALAAIALAVVVWQLMRRRARQSLDEALRSRRH